MTSSDKLEKILLAARRNRVMSLKFDGGELTEVHFFIDEEKNAETRKLNSLFTDMPVAPASFPHDEAVQKALDVLEKEMPSDEEFKFFHSPIVEAPDPMPQEEIRKNVIPPQA